MLILDEKLPVIISTGNMGKIKSLSVGEAFIWIFDRSRLIHNLKDIAVINTRQFTLF